MTDEELVKRMRERAAIHKRLQNRGEKAEPWPHLFKEAADRIEELEAKLAENEVRLGKAVEALREIVVDDTWGLDHKVYMKCRKVLREIEGEKE